MPTIYGDSIISLYGVTYTPRYFAICPDHSMKGFNYGAEENIIIFIDNCGISSSIKDIENNFSVAFYNNSLHIISNKKDNVTIQFYNTLGQLIDLRNIELKSGNNNIKLNLKKDFYIIRVYSKTNNYIQTIKISIN